MKVFLTGATGYIGGAVAERLQAAGHAVIGLARSDAAEQKLKARGIEARRGDLSDKSSLKAASQGADAVIHAAATNNAEGPKADKAAVEAIVDALKGSNKPFIYTSGIWVLGNTGNTPLDETAPYHPLAIVAWRPAVEELALASAGQGVGAKVLRPALVYGRAAGIPAMLVGEARQRGKVRYVGSGDQSWTFVHVEDLSDLYVRVLTQAPAGSVWHGAAGEPVLAKAVAEAAARAGGAGGAVSSLPLEEARKTMGPFADALAANQKISSRKAQQTLGWKPIQPPILEDLTRGSYAR
jgi:nucleoside-diphosphate-sugar epimerase